MTCPAFRAQIIFFQFFLKLAGVKIAPDGLCCVKWMDIGVIRFKVKQPGPVDTDSAAEAGPFIPNDPAELIGHVPVDDHYMGAANGSEASSRPSTKYPFCPSAGFLA